MVTGKMASVTVSYVLFGAVTFVLTVQQGHLVFPNGDVYDGEFSDDGISGRGKLSCTNGMVYEGEFKDDLVRNLLFVK